MIRVMIVMTMMMMMTLMIMNMAILYVFNGEDVDEHGDSIRRRKRLHWRVTFQ